MDDTGYRDNSQIHHYRELARTFNMVLITQCGWVVSERITDYFNAALDRARWESGDR